MKTRLNICQLCDEGSLHPQVEMVNIVYKNDSLSVEMHSSVCDVCECVQTNNEESKFNKRSVIAAKKMHDGLLTGHEIREIRQQLKLNQTIAAEIFGGGPVAFSKYEHDDVTQSKAMDMLIRVARDIPNVIDYLKGEFSHLSISDQDTCVKPAHLLNRKSDSNHYHTVIIATIKNRTYSDIPDLWPKAQIDDSIMALNLLDSPDDRQDILPRDELKGFKNSQGRSVNFAKPSNERHFDQQNDKAALYS